MQVRLDTASFVHCKMQYRYLFIPVGRWKISIAFFFIVRSGRLKVSIASAQNVTRTLTRWMIPAQLKRKKSGVISLLSLDLLFTCARP